MSSAVNAEAEAAKQKGNERFATQDYEGAIKFYSEAAALDPTQWTYPLNRCFAYLKLERWAEAEADATAVLKLDASNSKAWYRRSLARRGLEKFSFARADIWSYGLRTGDFKTVVDHNTKTAVAEAAVVRSSIDTPSCAFKCSESARLGLGAFATRDLYRGDLVLIEEPLYTVSESALPDAISAAVENLSEGERSQLATLQNNFVERFENPFVGIHETNAFAAGERNSVLCLRASRFNHSCTPNARYSWHVPTATFRIYALQPVAAGEELLVSYISSRNVYGSTAAQRQTRLEGMLGFLCSCTSCTLRSPDAQAASDARRLELTRLWDAVPYFMPHQITARLQSIARAVAIMKEERYCADADDYTHDAAAICTYHSDWASAAYWGRRTYESRASEFGADSLRALDGEVLVLLLEPKKYRMAGKGSPGVFSIRVSE